MKNKLQKILLQINSLACAEYSASFINQIETIDSTLTQLRLGVITTLADYENLNRCEQCLHALINFKLAEAEVSASQLPEIGQASSEQIELCALYDKIFSTFHHFYCLACDALEMTPPLGILPNAQYTALAQAHQHRLNQSLRSPLPTQTKLATAKLAKLETYIQTLIAKSKPTSQSYVLQRINHFQALLTALSQHQNKYNASALPQFNPPSRKSRYQNHLAQLNLQSNSADDLQAEAKTLLTEYPYAYVSAILTIFAEAQAEPELLFESLARLQANYNQMLDQQPYWPNFHSLLNALSRYYPAPAPNNLAMHFELWRSLHNAELIARLETITLRQPPLMETILANTNRLIFALHSALAKFSDLGLQNQTAQLFHKVIDYLRDLQDFRAVNLQAGGSIDSAQQAHYRQLCSQYLHYAHELSHAPHHDWLPQAMLTSLTYFEDALTNTQFANQIKLTILEHSNGLYRKANISHKAGLAFAIAALRKQYHPLDNLPENEFVAICERAYQAATAKSIWGRIMNAIQRKLGFGLMTFTEFWPEVTSAIQAEPHPITAPRSPALLTVLAALKPQLSPSLAVGPGIPVQPSLPPTPTTLAMMFWSEPPVTTQPLVTDMLVVVHKSLIGN